MTLYANIIRRIYAECISVYFKFSQAAELHEKWSIYLFFWNGVLSSKEFHQKLVHHYQHNSPCRPRSYRHFFQSSILALRLFQFLTLAVIQYLITSPNHLNIPQTLHPVLRLKIFYQELISLCSTNLILQTLINCNFY